MTGAGLLPPELIDIIIDHLHDDIQTLRSCSLVRHSWVSASQYHLLSSVLLDLTLPRKTIQRFFDLLARDSSPFKGRISSLALRYPYSATHWEEVIPLLPSVEKLALTSWRHMIPADLKSFRAAGTFRKLKELSLAQGSMDFPSFVEFAAELPVLEALKLTSFGWRCRTEAERAAREHNLRTKLLPKLKMLHFGSRSVSAFPAFTVLIENGVVPRVESVQIDELERGNASVAARELFMVLGPSLQRLVIYGPQIHPCQAPYDLGKTKK